MYFSSLTHHFYFVTINNTVDLSCSENTAMVGRFANSAVRQIAGGFQVAAAERPNYAHIKLSSAWHPDMIRCTGGRGRTVESVTHPEFFYAGPPMPGVLPSVFDCCNVRK